MLQLVDSMEVVSPKVIDRVNKKLFKQFNGIRIETNGPNGETEFETMPNTPHFELELACFG